MRNLKKFLALVLAMMMAFSLMVTANAANEADNGTKQYADGSAVTAEFVEAVDVLYGMGIMTGDYGNFKPASTIMRSEMAAVLYRLMTGDTSNFKSPLYASIATERFSDVKESDWFAPYVGWCYDAGLTVGNNGKFNPWGGVTGYEAEIFVLRAMGYGKNGEYTGANFYVNASYDATHIGLLTDVSKTSFSNTLRQAARRDVVASIVFWAAQLPTVTWNGSTYNQYVGVPIGTGGNVLNPSLGEKNFGLTHHIGIVLGNKATGETGNYPTKIGFSVNPTITKGLNVGDDLATATSPIINGTLTKAEITDVIDDAAYQYLNQNNAENVTLAFNWDTNLDLFGHKVKVWYDNRGTSTTNVTLSGPNYNTSTVTFGTNCKTYALYDQAKATVVAAADADLAGALGTAAAGAQFGRTDAFFNYAFSRMPATRTSSTTKVSPIKANNDHYGLGGTYADADWPLYLLIDNGNGLDVVVSLDLTISKVVQDNDTVASLTTGILTQNGTGTAYFDLYDQIDPAVTGDSTPTDNDKYSNIANKNMVDSDAVALRDYVAAVAVTGTTGTEMGSTNTTPDAGNATPATGLSSTTSTYYYKVDKLVSKQTKTVWKYDQNTQEVFFSDGTSFKKSIFANAVDGSFKDNQYVMAPRYNGDYTFYLDKAGDYLFWETGSITSSFVYGTYIDWETKLASGDFIYPLVYVDAQGNAQGNAEKLIQNIATVDGVSMGTNLYNAIGLPKRDDNLLNSSGFLPGTYVGYAMNGSALVSVTNTDDKGTGFWQADTDNFGWGSTTTVINGNGLAIGAVPVGNATGNTVDSLGTYNPDHLFLTNGTKFVVVTGAGTSSQKSTVYNGLAEFLGAGNVSVKIDATTLRNTASLSGPYLDPNGDVGTDPYKLVYYSLSSEIYDQIYDPSAKVIDTVFIPEQMITRTPSVSGDLYFVGSSAASIINANDNATLYTMYKDGVAGSYWIDGLLDGDDDSDADTVSALGDNVFYQLVDANRTAHDGGKVYKLLPMSSTTANSTIIGQYYGTSTTTADATIRMASNLGAGTAVQYGYLATTRNAQSAFIGGRTGNDLFNVGNANVTNLYSQYTINSLADLNGTSSLTSNMGVDVSCVLGSNAVTVSQIYVNTVQTALP